MPAAKIDPKLEELAKALGVETRYVDIKGVEQHASPEALLAVFRALGNDIDRVEQAPRLLQEVEQAQWRSLLEPVAVAWEGVGAIEIRVPYAAVESAYRLSVRTEDGEVFNAEGQVASCPLIHDHASTGHQVRLVSLPGKLPLGYHQLTFELAAREGRPSTALLISAAQQVFVPTGKPAAWGVFVPLYALRSARSQGIGDLSDLQAITDWVSELGGSVVGTLPMLASFLDEPFEPSPYSPASRLAWNELFLDLERIPEVQQSAEAKRLLASPDAQQLRSHIEQPYVDYKAVAQFKRSVLEAATKQCFSAGGARLEALQRFAKSVPHIHDYAQFRAVQEQQRKGWPVWSPDLAYERLRASDVPQAAYRYHLFVQWNMHEQLATVCQSARRGGYGLYLDLPVGVHGDSFDTWRFPGAFARQLSAGAPPDALFAGGQNWGFPPLHPTRLREQQYAYFIDILRNHLRYAKVLRIDHVMGLHRLYSIPHGASATEGVYVGYRPEDLYAILSLESHRSGALLLGENLGTVPPSVTQAMNRHRVFGMHVLQYAVNPEATPPLPAVDPLEVASLNTHDMPPFASFWQGLDIEQRAEFGWIDEDARKSEHDDRAVVRKALRSLLKLEERSEAGTDDAPQALRACLRRLGESASPLVLVTLEDLWAETHPQNVPGTYREHPNWSHRLRYALEELRDLPEVRDTLERLERVRQLAGGSTPARTDISPIGDQDLHFFNGGCHDRIYEKLGAHALEVDGEQGTYFAVWAPKATSVSVVGDFNRWRPEACTLGARGNSGIWEGWVPGVLPGDLYKFAISGEPVPDPLAFAGEVPPKTASRVTTSRHAWQDDAWLSERRERQRLDRPMSIYEVHLGSWRRVPEDGGRFLSYAEAGEQLADYVQRMGFTHVELMPVMEHDAYGSLGYDTTAYFAPTSRYGHPHELMELVDRLHRAGIGVFFDWTPSRVGGRHHDHRRFENLELHSYLLSCARYWVERFHADGLRFDDVAAMLSFDDARHRGRKAPEGLELLRRVNDGIAREFPGVQMLADDRAGHPMLTRNVDAGGLGFGLAWDGAWALDMLGYFGRDPIHRRHHHAELVSWTQRAWQENLLLPLSHAEVTHDKGSLFAKMPGDAWQKLANVRALLGTMYAQPGKKLLFMGQEFGQRNAWNPDGSLDWHLLDQPEHRGMQAWVAHLNRLYRDEPALHELDASPAGWSIHRPMDDNHSIYAFLRRARDGSSALFVGNFTPLPRQAYRIGVPQGGPWREVANSDAPEFGGSGIANGPVLVAQPIPAHGYAYSLELTLPPLGTLVFRPEIG